MHDAAGPHPQTNHWRLEDTFTTRSTRELDIWEHSAQSFVSNFSYDHEFAAHDPDLSAYRHFEKWTQEYGPVFSLRQGFTTTIVVGRLQAANEIMEKEGAALVDRPHNISAGETLSGGMRVLLTPAGDRFKKMRR